MSREEIISEFTDELEKIQTLFETPNLIREVALAGINRVIRDNPPTTIRNSLINTKTSLENISDSSIKENYGIIYSQMCVLAASSLEAVIKKYFIEVTKELSTIRADREKLEKIKVNAYELTEKYLDLSSSFGQLILDKDNSSLQNLKQIKDFIYVYLKKELKLRPETELEIIFYLEVRHILVHKSGIIDAKFINATKVKKANLKSYKVGDRIELDEEDWIKIKQSFNSLLKEIVK